MEIIVRYEEKSIGTTLENSLTQMAKCIEDSIQIKILLDGMKLNDFYESQKSICDDVTNNLNNKFRQHGYIIIDTSFTKSESQKEVTKHVYEINGSFASPINVDFNVRLSAYFLIGFMCCLIFFR